MATKTKPFEIPSGWPKWNKRCGAKLRKRDLTCKRWAVIGNPRCKLHGSGGQKARELGQLRYLAWVICGGPQDMPVEYACRIALAVYAERVFKQGAGNVNQQMKAAMWLTSLLDDG